MILHSNENQRLILAEFEVLKTSLQVIIKIFVRFGMDTKMRQSKMIDVILANKGSLGSRQSDNDIDDITSSHKTLERRDSLSSLYNKKSKDSMKAMQMHAERIINAIDSNVQNENINNFSGATTTCTNAPFDVNETRGACVSDHAILHLSNSKSIRLTQINDKKDNADIDITLTLRPGIVASHGSANRRDDNNNSNNNSNNHSNSRNDEFNAHVMASASVPSTPTVQAHPLPFKRQQCIFTTYDVCRQDSLALQVMALLKICEESVLELYLLPYKVIATCSSNDKVVSGMIDCVSIARSGNDIECYTNLELRRYCKEIYCGPEECNAFCMAKRNFILSIAVYTVACYLLQIKDTHNGHIMTSNKGQVIHINFGFIFDISPDRFNVTEEMIILICGYNVYIIVIIVHQMATIIIQVIILIAILIKLIIQRQVIMLQVVLLLVV